MTQEEQPGEGSEPGEVNPDSPGEPRSQAPREELEEQPEEDQALLRERMEEALR